MPLANHTKYNKTQNGDQTQQKQSTIVSKITKAINHDLTMNCGKC